MTDCEEPDELFDDGMAAMRGIVPALSSLTREQLEELAARADHLSMLANEFLDIEALLEEYGEPDS